MTRIAVLDDWQDAARTSADWAPLMARADVEFFRLPFASEDDAALHWPRSISYWPRASAPHPASLVARLPHSGCSAAPDRGRRRSISRG
jgi:hypothetical protein